jgi:acyl-CoA synthetase (AMP-forming)/AMP-acid ligase II
MTVIHEVRKNSHAYQDLPALIDGDLLLTHRELWDHVDRLTNAFLDLGLKTGDRILCWLPNIGEALITELACLQSGGVWVTLNAGLTWPEVQQVIEATSPTIAVTTPELMESIPEEGRGQMYSSKVILVGEHEDEEGRPTHEFETLIRNSSSKSPIIMLSDTDYARLRYTSGTTGKAKAAVLSHRVYKASLKNLQYELHSLDSTDAVLHAAPLTHASAALIYPILAAGGLNVVIPSFDPQLVLDCIEEHKITTMFAVPTMLNRLFADPSFDLLKIKSLKTISYGGAPTPIELLKSTVAVIGPRMLQIYGLTEALHPITTLKHDVHQVDHPKLGSIGTLSTISEIKIRDDKNKIVSDGTVGELWVKGPNTMDGYWNDPEESQLVMDGEWVATGDMGYVDDDGFYWIVDRKKDVIISGGFNVYSSEIEHVLLNHPNIVEAVVIGIPDEDWGEKVHAVCRTDKQLLEREVISYCRANLAGYKTPKSVSFSTTELPKNSAGKYIKSELKNSLTGQI